MGERSPRFGWSSAARTDRGRQRASNQDAYLDRPDLGLWAVADGMGGHHRGDHASRSLVEGLGTLTRPDWLETGTAAVRQVLWAVNQGLVDEAQAQGSDVIGSTIVTLIAVGDRCAILWAGDSRAYRLRAGVLDQLTRDHTIAQELLEQGFISPAVAQRHPYSNWLSQAVGASPDLELDTRFETLRPGDRFLLCSDGLTKELTEGEIAGLLAAAGPAPTADILLQRACDAGGRDNVTAVVVDFLGGGPATDYGESPVTPTAPTSGAKCADRGRH